MAGENRAWKQGWPWGDQNFGISIFFLKWDPQKSGSGWFCFFANFWSDAPWGSQGYPCPERCENQKSKLGYFYRREPPKIKFLEHFVLFNPRARQNPQKKGSFPGSLNKRWEFGGGSENKTLRGLSNIIIWFYSTFCFDAIPRPYRPINIFKKGCICSFAK